MGKINIAITSTLISVLLMACGGGEGASDSDTTDFDQQPEENTGVPLNPIERSIDTVDQQEDDNSGVPLDNLERSDDDSTTRPLNIN